MEGGYPHLGGSKLGVQGGSKNHGFGGFWGPNPGFLGVLGSKSRVSGGPGYPQIPCPSGMLVPAFLGVAGNSYSSPKCPRIGLNLFDLYGEIGLPRTYDKDA